MNLLVAWEADVSRLVALLGAGTDDMRTTITKELSPKAKGQPKWIWRASCSHYTASGASPEEACWALTAALRDALAAKIAKVRAELERLEAGQAEGLRLVADTDA